MLYSHYLGPYIFYKQLERILQFSVVLYNMGRMTNLWILTATDRLAFYSNETAGVIVKGFNNALPSVYAGPTGDR